MEDDADICDTFRMYSAPDISGHHEKDSHGCFFLDICDDASAVFAPDSPCWYQVLSDAAQSKIEPMARIQIKCGYDKALMHISGQKISLICHLEYMFDKVGGI